MIRGQIENSAIPIIRCAVGANRRGAALIATIQHITRRFARGWPGAGDTGGAKWVCWARLGSRLCRPYVVGLIPLLGEVKIPKMGDDLEDGLIYAGFTYGGF